MVIQLVKQTLNGTVYMDSNSNKLYNSRKSQEIVFP